MAMKEVSIQTLKATLSSVVADAEAGATIVITRHSDAVAVLGPVRAAHVHRGRLVGTGRLKPALKPGMFKGKVLDVLLEDRGDR
jgi:prevent-host-death family protein